MNYWDDHQQFWEREQSQALSSKLEAEMLPPSQARKLVYNQFLPHPLQAPAYHHLYQCNGRKTTRDQRQLSDDSPPAPQMEQKIATCQMEMECVLEDGIFVPISTHN